MIAVRTNYDCSSLHLAWFYEQTLYGVLFVNRVFQCMSFPASSVHEPTPCVRGSRGGHLLVRLRELPPSGNGSPHDAATPEMPASSVDNPGDQSLPGDGPGSPCHRDTRGMHHMRFDTTTSQKARQPKSVATGFVGNADARDPAVESFFSLIAPTVQL